MSKILYILKYAMPYKGYIFLNVFFNFLYAFFNAISFLALMPMLEVLFGEQKKILVRPEFNSQINLKDYFFETFSFYVNSYSKGDESNALFFVIIVIIVSFLLKNLFNYLAIFFITYLRNGVVRDIQNNLYSKFLSFSSSFQTSNRKGDAISRITSDVSEIQRSFLAVLEMLIREPLTIIFALIAMMSISIKLTIYVLVFIPLTGWIISIIGKTLKSKSEKVQNELGRLISNVDETLSGLSIIQIFTAEDVFKKMFSKISNRLYVFSNKLAQRQSLASPISEFLGIFVIGIILFIGGRLVLVDGVLSGSAFIAYMGLAYGVLTPAKGFAKAIYSVRKGNAAASRVIEYLFYQPKIISRNKSKKIGDFKKEIVFKNVSFRYEKENVINKINFKIKKGETVALVGASGSGKTTLANLLARFYDTTKGSIEIDGTEIKDLNIIDLRKLFGYVTQNSILFHESVKNNLLISNPKASNEEIYSALKISNSLSFVEKLPDGIETIIGENGNKLSGGQKQRLSIARAILKNPPIMIMDEATSSLDTESEKLVQDALQKMMKNRTSFVIAHRLTTIKDANKIIVLDKGNIVEEGTHKSLLKENKIYKKLIELQSFN
ncbi:MAG: ABC transporter ATP-binding protein [Bacteroidota bacterium]|nr:ABC transporter ATP-binding protein [Bacteroidota bacterium]